MAVAASEKSRLPDECWDTPGAASHLSNIGGRLRDVAAVLAEHGLREAADHVAQAYGCIMGHLATQGQAGLFE